MQARTISPDRLIARIKTLSRRRRDLTAQVEEEQMRPWPDTQRIRTLKQERLGLKDAIHVTRTMLQRQGVQPPYSSLSLIHI